MSAKPMTDERLDQIKNRIDTGYSIYEHDALDKAEHDIISLVDEIDRLRAMRETKGRK